MGFNSRMINKLELEYEYLKRLSKGGFHRDQALRANAAKIIYLDKQVKASKYARDADREDGPMFIGYGGARGGGKSFWSLAQAGGDDCQRQPGLRVLFLRNVGKAALESLNHLRQAALSNIPHRFKTSGEIIFENGSFIKSGHFRHEKDIDSYLGQEYDVIILEEATLLKASKFNDIKTVLRTNKPNWRPRMYVTTNPGGIGHAFFKKQFIDPYKQGRETTTRFIPATSVDNPNLNKEYLGILKTLTGWKRKAWLDGDWDIAQGQYFSTFNDLHHIREFEAQKHWDYWLGFDYGRVHNTAVVLLGRDGDGHIYCVDEHVRSQLLPSQHAVFMKQMCLRHGVPVGSLRSIEAGHDVFSTTHTTNTISDDYRECGFSMDRADIGRINGASELLTLLGDPESSDGIILPPRITFHKRCVQTVESIKTMIHDPKRPDDVLKTDYDEESGEIGDDPYDACRYGVMKYRSTAQLVSGL